MCTSVQDKYVSNHLWPDNNYLVSYVDAWFNMLLRHLMPWATFEVIYMSWQTCHKQKCKLRLNALKKSKKVFDLTCIGCSGRGVGAVGTVCAIRGVETKVVWLCIIWHSARGAAVVLVRAELAKRRPCAMARLLAVVIAAVRRRGHWESRGLLRFVQAVVVAWGNLVRMHISI